MITSEHVKRIVQELEAETVEGISKHSTVKVVINGNGEFQQVKINKKAAPNMTDQEISDLQDKLLGAIIDASSKQKALVQQRLGKC